MKLLESNKHKSLILKVFVEAKYDCDCSWLKLTLGVPGIPVAEGNFWGGTHL